MVLKTGGQKEYKALRDVQAKAETNIEKKHVYVTIGQTAEMSLKKDVLEWVVSGDIKIQDFFYPLGSVASSSKEAAAMTWEFYKANFEKIWNMCKTASPSLMDAMITFSARSFCTSEAAAEVE
ncbi:NPEPPS, partial [Symbiodinium sp. CCMP2456]